MCDIFPVYGIHVKLTGYTNLLFSQNALAGALTLTSGRAPGPAPVSTGDGGLSLDLIVGVTGIRYHRAVAHPVPH